ncbi:ABC transporter substrate-binding protein [Microvirga sp. VF16]|uniref:ABC transporter substrate-binding protein n=1 Tax=Microvirga sp. VF16 TaxID=2807101 RepID=UPI00193D759D|nr:ABC transporter substrate-binding protein [Microvirga sp. VF16]QRM32614.1 ABC transporter substrate-binding protein [Microvirga sp. VF16]
MKPRVSRRGLIGGALAGIVATGLRAAPGQPRVISLDWGLAETLLALGIAPVGLPEAAPYADWVVEPALPPDITDIGLRVEPNFELMAALRPDLIVGIPEHELLRPQLERIAPFLAVPIYAPDGSPYHRSEQAARLIGEWSDRATAAERLIAETRSRIAAVAAAIRMPQPPLYIANFIDRRHLRVYGRHGLFQDVLDRLGLQNAWSGGTNVWGFATLGVEALAGTLQARLFYLEPVPQEARRTIAEGPLWRHLPLVRRGAAAVLPPVLMFGTLPAAARFARVLGTALAAAGSRA